MAMPVIYATHVLHPAASAMLAAAADLRVASALDPATLIREGWLCDIVIVRAPIPPEIFGPGTRLRAAIRHGAGTDMIPIEAATAAGVLVANVPGANAATVAEHVMMTALMLLRRFRRVDGDLRRSGWGAARDHAERGHDLQGRTIGLVGFGAVGQAVASLAAAFGVSALACSPSGRTAPGVEALPLDAVLARSDIVVLCCPLKPETRGLIDARRLALIRPGALLINVARGPVVVEDALIASLQSGHLAGAALDVFDTQPLPAGHPFFAFDNVILTPHMAGITDESMARMGAGAAVEALRVLQGALPLNLINPQAEPAYRARGY